MLSAILAPLAGRCDTPVDITVSSGGGTISTYSNVFRAGAGNGSSLTGGFQVQLLTINHIPVTLSPHATFCTELGENVSFTNYTVYEIVDLQYASAGTAGDPGTPSSSIPLGGIGAQSAAELRYLFDHYYVSEDIAIWTTVESQAFQLAVWEISHDPANFNIIGGSEFGGDFHVGVQGNAQRDAAIATAQTWLSEIKNANVGTGYISTTVNVWSLADDNGVNPTTGYQDLLFATFKDSDDGKTVTPLLPPPTNPSTVPEPSSTALAAAGLVALLARRSRRVRE